MTVEQKYSGRAKGNKQDIHKRVKEMIQSLVWQVWKNIIQSSFPEDSSKNGACSIMAYEPEVILLDEPFPLLICI